jgi:hypothetical protein
MIKIHNWDQRTLFFSEKEKNVREKKPPSLACLWRKMK